MFVGLDTCPNDALNAWPSPKGRIVMLLARTVENLARSSERPPDEERNRW